MGAVLAVMASPYTWARSGAGLAPTDIVLSVLDDFTTCVENDAVVTAQNKREEGISWGACKEDCHCS